ncbi:hypothetical protein [Limnoglobus roseus]|uniref:hypothetical protein n=1 Tax=Limnoglobus roseus TaxID=2598579 RepID=UPI0011EA835A|nr:hypothetical protein [Limnoglobus roseus]
MTDAAGQVGDAAGNVGQKIAGAASDAYDATKDAGHAVEGWAEDAYHATAKTVGSFEQEVSSLIRNHPAPALLIGFGAGLLIGTLAKKV